MASVSNQALCEEHRIEASHGLEHALRVLEHVDKARDLVESSLYSHSVFIKFRPEQSSLHRLAIVARTLCRRTNCADKIGKIGQDTVRFEV